MRPRRVYHPPMLLRASEMSMEAALRDLRSDDPRVRAAAADALGDLGEEATPEVTAALVPVLGDARWEVRCQAALSLAALGHAIASDHAALPALLARLDDDHADVRQAAAIALGRMGHMAAWDRLLAGLKEGPPDVRFQAAMSLAELDPPGAYEPLVAALNDKDAEVRAHVASALAVVGDRRAAGWLATALEDPDARVRAEAACALAILGDRRATEHLVPLLGQADEQFRVLDLLEDLGDPAAAPAVARLLRRFLAPQAIKVRAAAALLAVAPEHADAPRAKELLQRALKSGRPDVRGLAEEAAQRLGTALPRS